MKIIKDSLTYPKEWLLDKIYVCLNCHVIFTIDQQDLEGIECRHTCILVERPFYASIKCPKCAYLCILYPPDEVVATYNSELLARRQLNRKHISTLEEDVTASCQPCQPCQPVETFPPRKSLEPINPVILVQRKRRWWR